MDELINKYKLSFTIDNILNQKINTVLKSNYFNNNVNYTRTEKINFSVNEKFKKDRYRLKHLTIYTSENKKRIFKLFSNKKLPENNIYINNINIICNFYDALFDKEKRFLIDFYMLNDKKILTENDNMPARNNINSGSNLIEKGKIIIFRIEEWKKVLIHESIHYFNLHIHSIKKDLLFIYDGINTDSKLNPNEGYTEFLALIFYYKIFDNQNINDCLTKEIAWGFIQSAKVLRLKGFNSYEELFQGEKEYSQDTTLLSYFVLKTYFLFNKKYQKCIKLLPVNDDLECFKSIDLHDKKFSQIINYCIKKYDSKDMSMRLSLT